MRTLFLSVKHQKLVDGFPNAGPRPNITGMKKIYGYGKYGTVCVMCGNYLYNVPEDRTDIFRQCR